MDSSDEDNTREFKYTIALFISIVAIVLILSFIAFICSKIHLGYGSRVNSNSQHTNLTSTVNATGDDSFTRVDFGLDEATLNSFPKVLYSQARQDKERTQKSELMGEEGSSCSICLGEYKESDVLRLLPDCGHLFHQKCVDLWLRLHPTCPICRNSPIPSPLPNTPLVKVAPSLVSL